MGLPLGCVLARAGFKVHGIDANPEVVTSIEARQAPFAGSEPGLVELIAEVVSSGGLSVGLDSAVLRESEVVLICVETPVDADHRPRYDALRSACETVGANLRRGALVVVESTVAPGTSENVVRPILETRSGLSVGTDFFVGHCPERVMPGRLLENLRRMDRVCGGITPETAEVMRGLYAHIVEGRLDATDLLTAEIVKTAENAFRDVNIAFANEVALITESLGGDVRRVRELVNRSPGRNMLVPGAGVGGHCIPKDPWLLASSVTDAPIRLIPAARAVNDSMPHHVADLALRGLRAAGRDPSSAIVTILGYAYLENSGDVRNSPTRALAEHLRTVVGELRLHDPHVREYATDLDAAIAGSDALVVVVRHDEYRRLSLDAVRRSMRTPVLVDGRQVFVGVEARAAGFSYLAVGGG